MARVVCSAGKLLDTFVENGEIILYNIFNF
jgi:hypothetical protein